MSAYYNEWDKKTAAWLRELIKEGLIADGIVDERSICDVQPSDLDGFTQHHFFAGIGGWSYALRLAGWPDSRPVWTASLPCQPFSGAGEQKGASDDRHLWPHFFRLVQQRRPDTIFGEQVARAVGFNWLDGISADLEAEAYSVGSVVLGAHSAGAPHDRRRLYWVADNTGKGLEGTARPILQGGINGLAGSSCGSDFSRGVDNTSLTGGIEREHQEQAQQGCNGQDDGVSGQASDGSYPSLGMGDTNHASNKRLRPLSISLESEQEPGGRSIPNAWKDFDVVGCADGKARRIESGTFPLAHGFPGRVGLLRGYGNAIVSETAAIFIQAFIEAQAELTP